MKEYKDRISKIKGQVDGIEGMITDGRNCTDVLQQIIAVRAALEKLGILLIEKDAKRCIRKGRDAEFDSLMKNLFKLK